MASVTAAVNRRILKRSPLLLRPWENVAPSELAVYVPSALRRAAEASRALLRLTCAVATMDEPWNVPG